MSEDRAHQVSTGTLLALFFAYFSWLNRRHPLPSDGEAWAVGADWTAMTVAFEFGFGHFVNGDSWSKLLDAYDVRKGRLWILVPLWTLTGPVVVRRIAK